MSQSAVELVENMSDEDAIRFLQFFGNSIFESTPRERILEGVPVDLVNSPEMVKLRELSPEQREAKLSREDSAKLARALLTAMAQDESLGPAMGKAWEKFEPRELFVETILAAGFVAGMLLFVSTTEIEGEVLGLKIKKGAAPPVEALKAVAESFFTAVGKLAGK